MKQFKRAEELKGRNGKLVGSEEYFRELNNTYLIISQHYYSNFEYDKIFNAINAKVKECFREILYDCQENAKYFSFADSSKRGKLISFVKGMEKFSEFVRNRNSDCRRCESYLELRESDSKRHTNISERELDTAVGKIYSGYRDNLGTSGRKDLIKKAAENSVMWAAGKDTAKTTFIVNVMNGHGQDFLKDVINRYEYVHGMRMCIKGRCGCDMFSESYIKHYEEKISGKVLQSMYMYSGSYDYWEFFKKKLKDIVEEINSDFDRGVRGTSFIKYDKQENIEKASEGLKKFGVDTKYIEINMKRFEIEDVTDKLMAIFREAKRDGEALREKYPDAILDFQRIQKLMLRHATINNPIKEIKEIYDTINLISEFIGMVKSWAYYDIKRRFSWNQDLQYMFDGMVLDFDDPGNMAFGIVAKAAGIEEFITYLGAGIYNFYEAVGIASFLNSVDIAVANDDPCIYDCDKTLAAIEGIRRESQWMSTYFDDPRDHAAIKKGFEYYYKI